MTILGLQRVPFGRFIEIGGELPDNSYNGMPWSHEGYQAAVGVHLRGIQSNGVGQIILEELRRKVLIVPREQQDGNARCRPVMTISPGYRDTDAPVSDRYSDSAGIMEGLSRVPGLETNPIRNTALGVIWTGSGAGTEVVVEFTPGFYTAGSAVAVADSMTGRATEVLLHEMVHALLNGLGKIDPRPMTGPLGAPYHDRAEFNAIMVTNIYRSRERPTATLRGSHSLANYTPLPNRETFAADFATEIDEFCAKVPGIAARIAAVPGTGFNPVRQRLAGASGP